MRLIQREIDYLSCVAEAFGHKGFSKAEMEVIKSLSDGLTYDQIDKARRCSGSRQINLWAKRRMMGIIYSLETPISTKDCFELTLRSARPAHPQP